MDLFSSTKEQSVTPSPRGKKALSVTDLLDIIQSLFYETGRLTVVGEVTNLTIAKSGHWYFSLKDANSQIKAIMFSFRNKTAPFVIEEGMKVECKGALGVYEKSGDLQFQVESIKSHGEGTLYQAFLKLRDELQKEGLFAPEHKQKLSKNIAKVAVVTSSYGAACHDIVSVLNKRAPMIEITLIHAVVQGDEAPRSIANAIKYTQELEVKFDALIVGRGGGSFEDLMAFNTREVAEAIFSSKIPIVSAVGHEIDFTIADFVADIRAPTPSAAAEMISFDISEISRSLSMYKKQAMGVVISRLRNQTHLLQSYQQFFISKLDSFFLRTQDKVSFSKFRINSLLKDRLHNCHQKISIYKEKIIQMNPEQALSRGYALVTNCDNKIVRKASEVQSGDDLSLLWSDGEVRVQIK